MKKKATTQPDRKIEADERNIVAVDEAYKEAGLEDRMYLIWHKYSTLIVGAVIAVFAGTILYFAMLYMAERREASIRDEYAAAETVEAREAFARDYPGHLLGGTAALEAGDNRFEAEEYEPAAEMYALASSALDRHPLGGRARLGEGMSYVFLGRTDDAERVFNALADDADALLAVRMEAKSQLALLAFEQGNYERVSDLFDRIDAEDQMGYWSDRVQSLVDEIP